MPDFIEGDGTGRDIWRASARLRRGGREGLRRQEEDRVARGARGREGVQADEQLAARSRPSPTSSEYLVGIKGPLTTPIGGGIRSLNVALRQMLDLYVCLRPVRWFKGVPSPVKKPGTSIDMVIFRENTEDIYAGIEFGRPSTADAKKFLAFLQNESSRATSEDPLPGTSGVGIKPVSQRAPSASSRGDQVRPRPEAQERHPRPQGQHHEVHRGAFMKWGYALAEKRVRGRRSPGARSGTWRGSQALRGENARVEPGRERDRRSRSARSRHQGRHRRSPTSRSSRC